MIDAHMVNTTVNVYDNVFVGTAAANVIFFRDCHHINVTVNITRCEVLGGAPAYGMGFLRCTILDARHNYNGNVIRGDTAFIYDKNTANDNTIITLHDNTLIGKAYSLYATTPFMKLRHTKTTRHVNMGGTGLYLRVNNDTEPFELFHSVDFGAIEIVYSVGACREIAIHNVTASGKMLITSDSASGEVSGGTFAADSASLQAIYFRNPFTNFDFFFSKIKFVNPTPVLADNLQSEMTYVNLIGCKHRNVNIEFTDSDFSKPKIHAKSGLVYTLQTLFDSNYNPQNVLVDKSTFLGNCTHTFIGNNLQTEVGHGIQYTAANTIVNASLVVLLENNTFNAPHLLYTRRSSYSCDTGTCWVLTSNSVYFRTLHIAAVGLQFMYGCSNVIISGGRFDADQYGTQLICVGNSVFDELVIRRHALSSTNTTIFRSEISIVTHTLYRSTGAIFNINDGSSVTTLSVSLGSSTNGFMEIGGGSCARSATISGPSLLAWDIQLSNSEFTSVRISANLSASRLVVSNSSFLGSTSLNAYKFGIVGVHQTDTNITFFNNTFVEPVVEMRSSENKLFYPTASCTDMPAVYNVFVSDSTFAERRGCYHLSQHPKGNHKHLAGRQQ